MRSGQSDPAAPGSDVRAPGGPCRALSGRRRPGCPAASPPRGPGPRPGPRRPRRCVLRESPLSRSRRRWPGTSSLFPTGGRRSSSQAKSIVTRRLARDDVSDEVVGFRPGGQQIRDPGYPVRGDEQHHADPHVEDAVHLLEPDPSPRSSRIGRSGIAQRRRGSPRPTARAGRAGCCPRNLRRSCGRARGPGPAASSGASAAR